MTSVYVVDDHPIVGHGVQLILDGEPDLTFAGASGALPDAVSAVARIRPEVILLDVRLPGTDAVRAVKALLQSGPSSRIALFTADPSHPHVRGARTAGAVATLAKDTAPGRLRELIREVAAGVAIPNEGIEASIFTARQLDVLTLVAVGLTNQEIADELGVQPTTVKTYWQEAMQRLGVRNRAEAIAVAYRQGLL
ncbi:DNA-binding response regulator [Rhodococcus sp. 06-462-5]|uniref:response regulator transcription factor n=1 Tax=Nocardiaceae TaxID=85025 RepID=UPI00050BE9A4|nr:MULTISPECIES: response regulator transcription factor [Rhodococcus]OZC73985.1 DNA-binding response regulator [Rhodococcus sp. 06-462-5]OZE67981.1 DNA-binding response regulator [Rhodococcus sp. 02-925g]OZF51998.1 DNA-binding response regulator [Rhodococcus sp. 14-1411-2a]